MKNAPVSPTVPLTFKGADCVPLLATPAVDITSPIGLPDTADAPAPSKFPNAFVTLLNIAESLSFFDCNVIGISTAIFAITVLSKNSLPFDITYTPYCIVPLI